MHTTAIGNVTFYHNGDFSGYIEIVTKSDGLVRVPYEVLKAFIAESIRTQKITQIEQASDDDLLGLTSL